MARAPNQIATTTTMIDPPTIVIVAGRSLTISQPQRGPATDSTSVTSDNSTAGTVRALASRHDTPAVCTTKPQDTHSTRSNHVTPKDPTEIAAMPTARKAPTMTT